MLMPKSEPSPSKSVEKRGASSGRGDDQDVADARHHQRRQRIVDHRLCSYTGISCLDTPMVIGYSRVPESALPRMMAAHQPAQIVSRSGRWAASAGGEGRGGRNTDVTWSCHDTERPTPSPVLLLGNYDAVVDIHPAGGWRRRRPGETRPLEQCRMALACAIRVAETRCRSLETRSSVSRSRLVQRVMPGEGRSRSPKSSWSRSYAT